MANIPLVKVKDIIGDHLLYVTRMWGFTPETWGAVTFSKEGTADRWVRDLPEGGYVLVFVSHHAKEEVDERDRGKVCGIYEFEPNKVHYTDNEALSPEERQNDIYFNENDEFRWPWMLKAKRAWRVSGDVLTRETLKDARSQGLEISSDMRELSDDDFECISRPHFKLRECKVYGRDFQPLLLKCPNAVANRNYLFTCENEDVLRRMPGWRPGDILIKPGIASDVDARHSSFTDSAVGRLFGLTLDPLWSGDKLTRHEARRIEEKMLEYGKLHGRIAAAGQEEFIFIEKRNLGGLLDVTGYVRKVA